MKKGRRLWYTQPAQAWTEALPLGNGRIGAMAFGGVSQETLSMNEDSLWSGYPRDTNVPGAAAHYRRAQEMIRAKQYAQTQQYIEEHMLGPFTQCYLPLCDLVLDFDGLGAEREYTRSLDLDEAVCRTEFISGGARHTREVFVSHPAQAMVLHAGADKPGQISVRLSMACQLRHQVHATQGVLQLRGIAPSQVRPNYVDDPEPVVYEDDEERRGMRFCAMASVEAAGGSVTLGEEEILVQGADSVVIRFAARTSFHGYNQQPYTQGLDEQALCSADLENARATTYDALRTSHATDHAALFSRVRLDLRGDAAYDRQPTDKRLKAFAGQPEDRGLVTLLFDYGRYLLIAASRPHSQATNLQGIWNHHVRAPWCSNYTVNINTEMNYWPAEVVALTELHQPLLDMIGELMETGARTAQVHYGAQGVVSHHNVDLWRLSNPVGDRGKGSAVYAFWPMSFGWLCWHLFEHYQFTRDRAFLCDAVLPALRGAARFYLDVMARDGDGYLSVTPATSPENSFIIDGQRCSVSQSATMSNAIVREVFENYLYTLQALEDDEEMAREVRAALPEIHPFQIGSKGQLLEWEKEFEEAEPHHRHVSHLYGLHPARQITPEKTPELLQACRRTLELRGDDGTGWSLGWKINFWARLRDGDRALKLIHRQLRFVDSSVDSVTMGGGGTYANLFDAHPPFQIDGNFGACAGIAEMLLQSNGSEVLLLPALPIDWPDGSIQGLRAHGGLGVDIEFRAGRLQRAVIRRIADCADPVHVRCQGRDWTLTLAKGECAELR